MRPQARLALWLTLGFSLIYVVGAALVAPRLIGNQRAALSNRLPADMPSPSVAASYVLRDIWLRFDTVWYLDVAREGYKDPHAVVFYPLYPLLIRGLGWLLGPMTAALLISRVAVFFLCWGLLLLLELDLPPPAARLAVLLLILWPSGFMLFAAYPDGLVLALTVWALWFARADRWWPAAVCAALACTAKAAGAAVLVALLVMCWQKRKFAVGPLLLGFSGALVYPLALWWSGLPQPAQMYPAYWRTTPALPWDTLWSAVRAATTGGDIVVRMDLTCLLLIAIGVAAWRGPLAYTLYSAALLGLFLTKKTDPLLQSTMRYLLCVFPAFAGYARWLRGPLTVVPVAFLFMLFHALFLLAFWNWSLIV